MMRNDSSTLAQDYQRACEEVPKARRKLHYYKETGYSPIMIDVCEAELAHWKSERRQMKLRLLIHPWRLVRARTSAFFSYAGT